MSKNSQIKESIYQNSESRILNQKDVKKKTNTVNEQTFLEYYEQNIRIKNRQQQLQNQVRDLQNKLKIQTNLNKTLHQNELRSAAEGKKKDWCKTGSYMKQTTGRLQSAYKSNDRNKNTEHLLEIIDHYKQKMLAADAEIINLKRQKQLLEQDVQVKERKVTQISNYQTQSHDNEGLKEKLNNTLRQLELEKERCKYLEADLKRLQAKLRTMELKNQQFAELKINYKHLEENLLRMTSIQTYNSINEKGDSQSKIRELEAKLKSANEKYAMNKDTNIRLDAEVKVLKTKLVQVNQECDELQRENQKLNEQAYQNPIFERLSKNPQLLLDVLSEIEERKMSKKQVPKSKEQFEKIILEKEDLAKQLISYKSKVKGLEETWKEKQKIHQIEKKQIISTIQNQGKVQKSTINANGIPYDEDVSMFTEKKFVPVPNVNYFDLYLGEIHLLENNIKGVAQINNVQNPLIIATVDFYNHNTMHSQLTQGLHCDLKSQFQFKINEDDFFFKYLNKGNFQVDIWASEGSKHQILGKITIELRPLITRCRPKIAPVVSASSAIYFNGKVMGSINMVMRMRLPIYQKIQKITQLEPILESVVGEKFQNRKLVIEIEQGKGFGDKCNSFVYFSFRLQDCYTKTYRGSNPLWNYFKMIDVKYNDDLKNYLRKNDLELTVFDDNAVIDQKNSDIIGSGVINLLPLLQNKSIKQRVQIRKNKQIKGTIEVKILWHDPQKIEDKSEVKPVYTMDKIHLTIVNYLKDKKMKSQDAFNFIDANRTGMISFAQFNAWVSRMDNQIQTQEISEYYNTIKQPVNVINFCMRIDEVKSDSNDIVAEIGMINKFFKNNTASIKKKKTLKEFLEGKDLIEICLDIDKNQNGKITKAELIQYFDNHGVEVEVKENEIQLVDFLKKYQNFT